MKKIKYLKPTKEQEKIMEDERKAICNLTVPKKRRTPPKCLAHWIHESVEINFRNLPKPNLSSTPMRVILV